MKGTIYVIVGFLATNIFVLSGCSIQLDQSAKSDNKIDSTGTGPIVAIESIGQSIATGTLQDSSDIPLQYKFRDQYDVVFGANENGMMIVKQGERFGLISQSGSTILETKYQMIRNEENGCFVFDDGFVLSNGVVILLSDHPKLQQFQKELLKTGVPLLIIDSLGEKVIFEKTNPNNTRSPFIYDIQEKKIWLPPIYSSLWKVDDDIIVAIKEDVIRILKTDKTIVYESMGYTGGYRLAEQNHGFYDGVMIMQDDSGLYGFIRKDGTWAMPSRYNELMISSSGTVIAVKKKDSEYAVVEIDKSGNILRTLSQEEGMNIIRYPNFHSDFSIVEQGLKNKKTGEIFNVRSGNITMDSEGSTIALKKGDKWSPYGFDDYRYDAIIFGFINGHSGDGFALSDGFAFVTEGTKKAILNANSNKIIFTFSEGEAIFNLYGGSKSFYQISSDLIAVHAGEKWRIIDKHGTVIADGYETLSILHDENITLGGSDHKYLNEQYLFAKKDKKSILISLENGAIQEHILKMNAGAAKMKQGVISLYDYDGDDLPDDTECFRNPKFGTDKCKQDLQKGRENPPLLFGYMYLDGYEKPVQVK